MRLHQRPTFPWKNSAQPPAQVINLLNELPAVVAVFFTLQQLAAQDHIIVSMRQEIADHHIFLRDFIQLLVLVLVLIREIRSVEGMLNLLLLQEDIRLVRRHFLLLGHIMIRRIIHDIHMLVLRLVH